VLVVDVDAQATTTRALGVDPRDGLLDVLTGRADVRDLISETPHAGIDVIPAGSELARAERALAGEAGAEKLLAGVLDELDGYETVLIDAPPGVSVLVVGALAAATEHIAPVSPDSAAIAGLGDALALADAVRRRLNRKLEPTRVLLARVPRTRAAQLASAGLRSRLGDAVLKSEIPERSAVVEAFAARVPITLWQPKHPVAEAFRALARELRL
jgi:chromosome partitioning protein